MWVLFSLLSALFSALLAMFFNKNKNIEPIVLNLGVFIFSTILLLPLVIGSLNRIAASEFYFILLFLGISNTIAFTIRTYAIHGSGLGLTMPFLSFTPLFLILTSFLILREVPSNFGLIGIIVVVIGSYVLNIGEYKKGLFEPFKAIFRNKGSWMMLIVAFLFAVNSPLFKKASNMVLPYDFIGLFFYFEFFFLALLAIIKYKKKLVKKLKLKKNWFNYLSGAVIFIFTELFLVLAVQDPRALISYAISIKRTAILFSVVFGYLFFKETDFKQKIIGSSVMVLGVIIISIFN